MLATMICCHCYSSWRAIVGREDDPQDDIGGGLNESFKRAALYCDLPKCDFSYRVYWPNHSMSTTRYCGLLRAKISHLPGIAILRPFFFLQPSFNHFSSLPFKRPPCVSDVLYRVLVDNTRVHIPQNDTLVSAKYEQDSTGFGSIMF